MNQRTRIRLALVRQRRQRRYAAKMLKAIRMFETSMVASMASEKSEINEGYVMSKIKRMTSADYAAWARVIPLDASRELKPQDM